MRPMAAAVPFGAAPSCASMAASVASLSFWPSRPKNLIPLS